MMLETPLTYEDILMLFFFAFMIWVLGLVSGILIGRIVGLKRSRPPDKQEREVMVRRPRPSFRNPTKTMVSHYDSYKTSKGLYGAQRAGKPGAGEQIERR